MQSFILFGMVKFLHDLFTAIWIGGMIVMATSVLPSLRNVLGVSPQTKKLSDTIMSRLSKLVLLSMIGLLLTGVMMSNRSPLFEGFLTVSNEYSLVLSVKHLIIALMVILSLFRSHGLNRMNINPQKQNKISMLVLVLNVVLGIGVLFVSGMLAALGATP